MSEPTYFAVDVETVRTAPTSQSLVSIGVVELATGQWFYGAMSSWTAHTWLRREADSKDSAHDWWAREENEAAASELFQGLQPNRWTVGAEHPPDTATLARWNDTHCDQWGLTHPISYLQCWVRWFPGERVFVAAPASFDWGHVAAAFGFEDIPMPWSHRTLDVRSWVSAKYNLPITCSRDEWPAELRHESEFAHHALYDALALAKTARVLLGIPEPEAVRSGPGPVKHPRERAMGMDGAA